MFNTASLSVLPGWGKLTHLIKRALLETSKLAKSGLARTKLAAARSASSTAGNAVASDHAQALHTSRAAGVRFEGVGKRYDSGEPALSGIDLQIAPGEFVVLVGPSGCGKSTLLRMLAGLESISAGRMLIDAQVVNDVSPRERDIAMVFQDYALYPHKTVYDNLAFGLQVRGTDKAEVAKRVQEVAAQLKIVDLLQRKPAALSGGQRQRVAIGRALIRKARLFLFDEPLSNLDVKLRNEMRVELKKLHRQFGITTLYVTHDQVEAMTLGDRIAVMSKLGIEQYGSPQQIYGQPRTIFVAEFIGSPAMNLLALPVIPNLIAATIAYSDDASPRPYLQAIFGVSHLHLPVFANTDDGKPITQAILGIRPEHIQRVHSDIDEPIHAASTALASPTSQPDLATLTAVITFIEPLGAETIVTLEYSGHLLRARWAPDPALQVGQNVRFSIAAQYCLWFDAVNGTNLHANQELDPSHD